MFFPFQYIDFLILILTDLLSSYWYRLMFDEHFPPTCAGTVERWTPTWSKQSDPSGR
jgi:asparagine synthase (glutamine-hydrolysing)